MTLSRSKRSVLCENLVALSLTVEEKSAFKVQQVRKKSHPWMMTSPHPLTSIHLLMTSHSSVNLASWPRSRSEQQVVTSWPRYSKKCVPGQVLIMIMTSFEPKIHKHVKIYPFPAKSLQRFDGLFPHKNWTPSKIWPAHKRGGIHNLHIWSDWSRGWSLRKIKDVNQRYQQKTKN